MSEATISHPSRRLAWLAVVLSILMPGVGHVYCGRLVGGLVFGLLYAVAIPVILGLLAYIGPAPTVQFGLLMVAAAFGIVVVATIDSYRQAHKARSDYELKVYNRPAVYLLLGLMIEGGSVGFALHIRGSLFEAFRIPAASMYPAIAPNDRILVDKRAYRTEDPRPGDIVIFHPPTGDWRMNWIKRVVAVAGETVEMKDGLLYVNGQPLSQRRVGSGSVVIRQGGSSQTINGEIAEETNGSATYRVFLTTAGSSLRDFAEITLPEHHCFLVGDNRNYSLDSRQFGPVPLAMIEGRVDYLYWPADTWSRFGRLR